jgi:ribonuclease E
MKRMLINATQEEELRMAMVDGQLLFDLNIEAPASERKKANIYKGKITRIEPSLEAAFIDYGADRHGFLPMKEISSEYYVKEAKPGSKVNIKDVLREGQDIVVQVDKEERGNKGAALTTFVSLAGRFIVLKPNKDRSGGVSRRITGEERDLARQSLKEVEIPDSMSVILRTAGIDRSAEELAWDLENLLTVWSAILNVVLERTSPFLIYRESDSVVRALRDYLTNDIGEILIDDAATYKDAYEHVEQTMPHNLKKLKHYVDPVPLFTRFQIESQIESAFAHNVTLPSGGSIVIDHTEALVSIDINSARATKGADIETTAFNTNLEAADEIARQLRIRDLGGLIVIDFIDMGPQKNQREVENRLRGAVRQDRARVQIGKISRFGLLEMSRQRLRPSIGESAYKTCPRCTGFGTIRGTESLALAILRIVGEEARKERTAKVIAQLPVEVATYLLNEKRDWVQSLEDRNDTQIVLIANPALETPHYTVRRVRDDQTELTENTGVSFSLQDMQPEPESPQAILERKGAEVAAVGTLKPSTKAPQRKTSSKGFWASLFGFFTSDDDTKKKKQQKRRGDAKSSRGRRSQQQSRNRNDTRQSGEKRGRQRSQSKKKTPAKQQSRKSSKQEPNKNANSERNKSETKPQSQSKGPTEQDSGDTNTSENKTDQKRTRSRRSRGGRRRRRPGKSETNEQVTDSEQQATDSTADKLPAEQESQMKSEQPERVEPTPPTTKKPEVAVTQKPASVAKPDSAAKAAPVEKPKTAGKSPSSDTTKAADKTSKDSTKSASKDVSRPATTNTQAEKPAVSGDQSPGDKPKPAAKIDKSSGPPKVRTDAERANDAKKLDDTASHKIPKMAQIEPAPVEKPAAKLLPWDDDKS